MRPLTKPEFYAAILVLARDSAMDTRPAQMENAWRIYQSPDVDHDAYRKRVWDAFATEFGKSDRWIPLNLPWRNSDAWREVSRLSDEYATWFDARTQAMFGLAEGWSGDILSVNDVLESCPDLDTTDWSDAQAYDAFVARHTDDDVRLVASRRRRKALCDLFESSDPECLEWRQKIADALDGARRLRFCDHELCRPGVAVEIRSLSGELRRAIIGDGESTIEDDDVIVRCIDLMSLLEELS